MNKLKTLAIGAFALCAMSTVSVADSSDFAGPYVGIQVGAVGLELDAKNTDGNGSITKAKGGVVEMMAGIDLGYAIPVNDNVVIGVGVSWVPLEADLIGTTDGSGGEGSASGDTASDPTKVTVALGDHYTIYIQPTYAISDTAAVFAKVGYATAEVEVVGQTLVSKPDDIDGTTTSIGTKVNLANGMYIQSEAGITSYNEIKGTGAQEAGSAGGAGLNGSASADPTLAFGIVTIGMKF
tara:strand:+ start:108 stop:821 length:714 start_codon:yes stop_codon:yes gene_type:complete